MKDIINFNDIKKEYDVSKKNQKIDEDLKRQAKQLFEEALYSKISKEKAYNKALDAYELYPSNYEYKTYAISLINNAFERMMEYEYLYKEINQYIDSYCIEESIIQIYSIEERNSTRYKDLKYALACSYIENHRYREALQLLNEFDDNVTYKTKHLIMNIHLVFGDYKECVDLYDNDRSIIYLIPLSYAYLKLHKYKLFVEVIKEIQELNDNFKLLLFNLNVNRLKKIKKYHYTHESEIYYSFKYFYSMYKNDKEYVNEINKVFDLEK